MMDKDPYLLRLFYSVAFYVVYRLIDFVVVLVCILQFAHQLFMNEPHAELTKFSGGLANYVSQIIRYLSWGIDEKPFPFNDWPSSELASSELPSDE